MMAGILIKSAMQSQSVASLTEAISLVRFHTIKGSFDPIEFCLDDKAVATYLPRQCQRWRVSSNLRVCGQRLEDALPGGLVHGVGAGIEAAFASGDDQEWEFYAIHNGGRLSKFAASALPDQGDVVLIVRLIAETSTSKQVHHQLGDRD